MKKVLSVILSITLIFTAVPLVFATECEHIFNAETADRSNCTFICSNCNETVEYELADYSRADTLFSYDAELNLYTTEEYAEAACEDFYVIFDEILLGMPENLSVYEQEELDLFVENAEEKFRSFSSDVTSGKYGPAIDAALLQFVMTKYDWFVANHEPLEDYFSPETLHNIKVIQRYEFYNLTVIYQELSMDPSSVTEDNQVEFERRLKIADDMVNSMYSCTAGEHNFGEDHICEFCGEIEEIDICEYCGKEHTHEFDVYFCFIVAIVQLVVEFISHFI